LRAETKQNKLPSFIDRLLTLRAETKQNKLPSFIDRLLTLRVETWETKLFGGTKKTHGQDQMRSLMDGQDQI
jgi:hypothetical protein